MRIGDAKFTGRARTWDAGMKMVRNRDIVLLLWSVTLAAASTAGCAATADTVPLRLSISNQTTMPITLRVNDVELIFPPGSHRDPITPSSLPSPPWRVEAVTPSGRQLAVLDLQPGDIVIAPNGSSGEAVRVDLSCGRFEMWAGPPLLGPGPPASFPANDCET
jgi:hypothetical protein